MTKHTNKAFALFLSLALCACFLPATAIAVDNGDGTYSGTFSGVDYTIANGVLTITSAETPADGVESGLLELGGESTIVPEWTQSPENLAFTSISIAEGEIVAGDSLEGLFENCSKLEDANDVQNINTTNTVNMNSMFAGCSNLSILSIPKLNTSSVTTYSDMFPSSLTMITVGDDCKVLRALPAGKWYGPNDMTYADVASIPESAPAGTYRNFQTVQSIDLPETASASLSAGTYTLTATITPEDALINGALAWQSSNESVATVASAGANSLDGVVTLKSAGTTDITVSAGGVLSEACDFTVTASSGDEPSDVPVTGITLNKEEVTLKGRVTSQLKATVSPANATNKDVTWSSSAESVATVSEAGLVTAAGPGTATITATCGDKTASCAVTVLNPPATVSVLDMPTTIKIGETATVNATVNPAFAGSELDPAVSSYEWTIVPEGIATVEYEGATATITPDALGEADLVVTVKADGINPVLGVFDFTVTYPTVTSIALNPTKLDLTGAQTESIAATIAPSTVTSEWIKWSSSDPEVATVSATSEGATVTSVSKGTTTITAASGDGTVKATCQVTVSNPATKISTSIPTLVRPNETFEVAATLTGALPGEIDPVDSITWSVKDDTIATVTADKDDPAKATIESLKLGKTEITVTAKVGDETLAATYNIEVANPDVESVKLSDSELTINVIDEPVTLTATVMPAIQPPFEVSWATSDPEIATVDENGAITPVSAGEAIIYAASGSVKAECKVTVTPYILSAYEDSPHSGYLAIPDAITAKSLIGLYLNITDDTESPVEEIQAAIDEVADDDAQYVEAYDIILVDQAGIEVPYDEPDHSVEVNISVSEAVTALANEMDFEIYYVNEDFTAAVPMRTWMNEGSIAFETTHFSTYALTATPKEMPGPADEGDRNTDDEGNLAKTGEKVLAAVTAPTTLNVFGIALALLIIAIRRICRKHA